MKRVSRRYLFSLATGLFAFIPAVGYLASAPHAFAFVPCDNVEFIVCEDTEPVCGDFDNPGTYVWYNKQVCYDDRVGNNDAGICYYTYEATEEECNPNDPGGC